MTRSQRAIHLYTAGLLIAAPIVLPWVLWRWRRRLGQEPWVVWRSRLGWFPRPLLAALRVHRPWIWIHAASIGETLALRPLVSRLRELWPQSRILFSAVTREAVRLAETQRLGDVVTVAPLDVPWAVRRLLRAAAPQLVLLVETELWPNLIRLAKVSGAKIAVVNGRISAKSFTGYQWLPPLFRAVLQDLDLWAMREPADAARIQALGGAPERIHVTGNLKYDIWPEPTVNPAVKGATPNAWGLCGSEALWVAGSVHPEEVPILLETFQTLSADSAHWRLALAPRHLDTLPVVLAALETRRISYERRSQGGRFAPQTPCVVVDTIGELSSLYRLGRAAFVGGSLIPHGGQNPIEPALAGVPVLFGPHMTNFRETAQLLLQSGGAWEVRDPAALVRRLRALLADPPMANAMGQRASQAILTQRGAAQRTVVLLQQLLDEPPHPPQAPPSSPSGPGLAPTLARAWLVAASSPRHAPIPVGEHESAPPYPLPLSGGEGKGKTLTLSPLPFEGAGTTPHPLLLAPRQGGEDEGEGAGEVLVKRVLVIRLSSLGDIVLTTPVYRNLKEAWPGCRISVLVKAPYVEVLANHPDVDEVIAWRASSGTWRQLQALRQRRFDVVIDLHGTLRSRIISGMVGASRRFRYRKASWARRVFVWWRRRPPELRRHTVDRYLDVLRGLGLTPRRYPLDLLRENWGQTPNVLRGSEDRKGGHEGLAPAIHPLGPPSIAQISPKRILIVQTAFVGDAVLTTPLVRAVREAFPEAVVIVVCTPQISDVFRRVPGLDVLVLDDKRGKGGGLRGFWRMVQQVRRLSCDVALLPHRSVRSALLVRFAGIPRRIGFNASPGRWWYSDQVPFLWEEHDVHRNLRLLEPLEVQPAGRTPELFPPQEGRLSVAPGSSDETTARQVLEIHGVTGRELLVGIAPGSLWATKRWFPERFAAVADGLVQEFDAKILLFGSAADRSVVNAVQGAMRSPSLNLAGRTSLAELIALIARCRLFLSNDSGAMHIAVATGVPTIALFGPTTRELGFAPYGEGHLVIERDLPCRPCSVHGGPRCPEGHFRCMDWISGEDVLQAAREKLRQVLVPA